MTDVLVVGAGPTGLMLALELVHRGLTVRIVDQSASPSGLSRAIVVHARTLEVLDERGLAAPLVARGLPLRGLVVRSGDDVIVEAALDQLPTRFPYALSVSQAETEAVLSGRLREAGVEVQRATRLVSFRQDGVGVDAVVEGPDGDEHLRAGWLVGCDGAHSVVRRGLGLEFTGATYEERLVLADVGVPWDLPRDRIATWLAEDGICACFPLAGGGNNTEGQRMRIIASAPEGLDGDPTLADIQALFTRRTGSTVDLLDPTWIARFRIHCRQVARYADDRVMLAGDAAHIHSPVGGQGMNTGIQDAHNLAWKLAMAHKGSGRFALLGTYGDERHGVGAAVLRATDTATRMVTLRNPIVRAVRDQLASLVAGFGAVRERVARQVAELDVCYAPGPLVFGESGPGLGKRVADDVPSDPERLTLVVPHDGLERGAVLSATHTGMLPWAPLIGPIHEHFSRSVHLVAGAPGDQAWLVRPDRYLAARVRVGETDRFLDWLGRWVR